MSERAWRGPPPRVDRTTGDTLTARGAVNNTNYAVAVAGVDDLGNPGVLSPISCAEPKPVDDFFTIYNRDGGLGGCIGGCVVARGSEESATLSVLGLGVAMLALRRRS